MEAARTSETSVTQPVPNRIKDPTEGGLSVLLLDRFITGGKSPRYQLYRRLRGPHNQSRRGREEEKSAAYTAYRYE
jgi:hypothetical protein